jgi:hypothetical protein
MHALQSTSTHTSAVMCTRSVERSNLAAYVTRLLLTLLEAVAAACSPYERCHGGHEHAEAWYFSWRNDSRP